MLEASAQHHAASSGLGLPVVSRLTLTVGDLERSIAMFQALDFQVREQRYLRGAAFAELTGLAGAEARAALLQLGAEHIELRQFVTPLGRHIEDDSRSNDGTFQHLAIVVRDMDEAFARLRALPGIQLVSSAPQTLPASNPAAGGIRALYFKDADGHNLELIWFPADKGSARWHAQTTGTFLGIDHSAIAVADSARSQSFYEGLGFTVSGRSLNYGVEQERLSGVPGARVQITGLSPQSGPGVEFLSYQDPGPGKPAPDDSAANDLWHWEIDVEVADLGDTLQAVAERTARSSGATPVVALEPGYRWASLVQDHDGHTLRLLQR
jgi:catechol 2,3-dioxygenase-like lactoylglutathione lyase family enzyme